MTPVLKESQRTVTGLTPRHIRVTLTHGRASQSGADVDDWRVDAGLGVDPLVLVAPPHLGGVAERDIVHVDQYLVLALPVPDLPVACLLPVSPNGQ